MDASQKKQKMKKQSTEKTKSAGKKKQRMVKAIFPLSIRAEKPDEKILRARTRYRAVRKNKKAEDDRLRKYEIGSKDFDRRKEKELREDIRDIRKRCIGYKSAQAVNRSLANLKNRDKKAEKFFTERNLIEKFRRLKKSPVYENLTDIDTHYEKYSLGPDGQKLLRKKKSVKNLVRLLEILDGQEKTHKHPSVNFIRSLGWKNRTVENMLDLGLARKYRYIFRQDTSLSLRAFIGEYVGLIVGKCEPSKKIRPVRYELVEDKTTGKKHNVRNKDGKKSRWLWLPRSSDVVEDCRISDIPVKMTRHIVAEIYRKKLGNPGTKNGKTPESLFR